MAGFEPATTRPPDECASQSALHPEKADFIKRQKSLESHEMIQLKIVNMPTHRGQQISSICELIIESYKTCSKFYSIPEML